MTFKCPALIHVSRDAVLLGAQVCPGYPRCARLSSVGKLLLSIKTSWSKSESVTKVLIQHVNSSRHSHLYSAGGSAALIDTAARAWTLTQCHTGVWGAGQHREVFGVKRCTQAGVGPARHSTATLRWSPTRGQQAEASLVSGSSAPC